MDTAESYELQDRSSVSAVELPQFVPGLLEKALLFFAQALSCPVDLENTNIDIAELNGGAFRSLLASADAFSERAILFGSFQVSIESD